MSNKHMAEVAGLGDRIADLEHQLAEHGCRKVEREAFRQRDEAQRQLAEAQGTLQRLESVTRSYLRYPLEGEEPGYSAEDVLAYCDEARAAFDATPEEAGGREGC